MEKSERKCTGVQTQVLNIRYFMITDHINKNDLSVKHCLTDLMVGDYFTKPLQGTKFEEFRKRIMGIV